MWVALFTLTLTVSTILLWLETRRLARGAEAQAHDYKESLRVAKISADATLTQANAFLATQRPTVALGRITLVIPDPGNPEKARHLSRGPIPEGGALCVTLENAGPTTATLIQSNFHWTLGPLKTVPAYGEPQGMNHVLPAGATLPMYSDQLLVFSAEERAAIDAGTITLWCFGIFAYENPIEETWEVGYVGRWNFDSRREGASDSFILTGPKAYTYQRQRN